MLVAHKNDSRTLVARVLRQRYLLLVAIPGVLWFLLFSYYPMWGSIIAFKNFDFGLGILQSPWSGLDHFVEFVRDPDFATIMTNTVAISALKLVFGFPAPILLALLLNELRSAGFKSVTQTVSYLPHFVSWVIVTGVCLQLLSPTNGPIIPLLAKLGVVDPNLLIMGDPNLFWGLAVVTEIWKEIGWNAIIYLAAITAIDPVLYEAAKVDGAGKLRQVFAVTLPSIAPTVFIMLTITIAYLLTTNFDQLWLMRNSAVVPASEVIDTHVFVQGIQLGRYDYATAVGLFRSVVSLGLLVAANQFSRRITGTSLY